MKRKSFLVELGNNMVFGTYDILKSIITSEPFIIIGLVFLTIASIIGLIWLFVKFLILFSYWGIPLFLLLIIFVVILIRTVKDRLNSW